MTARHDPYRGNQIALIDVDNFYCEAERAFDPSLRRRPLAVGSNNDSCLVARSAEVKALGVKMGTPVHELKELFQVHGVTLRSSNYTLYADLSDRFTRLLEQLIGAPDKVMKYSIDENFILFDWPQDNLESFCAYLIATVKQWLALPCSAGIGSTKTLAKCASWYAKMVQVPGRALQIKNEINRQELLKVMPVGKVWGVGSKLREKFRDLGIHTAWDLANAHIPTMRRAYGVTVERTIRELNNEPCITLHPMDSAKAEIVSGRTFGRYVDTIEGVMAALANHVALAVEKLRAQSGAAGRLGISIGTNVHAAHQVQYHGHAYTELRPATASVPLLTQAARSCLEQAFRPGYRYYRVAVTLSALTPEDKGQADLFQCGPVQGHGHLTQILEAINDRYGRGTVTTGTAKQDSKWEMRRQYLSPSYTTNFKEIPRARCD